MEQSGLEAASSSNASRQSIPGRSRSHTITAARVSLRTSSASSHEPASARSHRPRTENAESACLSRPSGAMATTAILSPSSGRSQLTRFRMVSRMGLSQSAHLVFELRSLVLVVVLGAGVRDLRPGQIQLRRAQFDNGAKAEIVPALRQVERELGL